MLIIERYSFLDGINIPHTSYTKTQFDSYLCLYACYYWINRYPIMSDVSLPLCSYFLSICTKASLV